MRRKWLVLIALSAGVVAVYLSTRRDPEPSFDRRPLSYWLDALANSNGQTRERAERAIMQIGTNGLPCALKWTFDNPPGWRTYLGKARNSGRKWIPNWATDEKAIKQSENAVGFFHLMGPDAAPAIPQLAELARHPDRKMSSRAFYTLFAIGNSAFPAFVGIIADTNSSAALRGRALEYVNILIGQPGNPRNLGTNAILAVPALIRNLDDADPIVAVRAAAAIGYLRLQPEISIPALIEASKDPRPEVSARAIEALRYFPTTTQTNP